MQPISDDTKSSSRCRQVWTDPYSSQFLLVFFRGMLEEKISIVFAMIVLRLTPATCFTIFTISSVFPATRRRSVSPPPLSDAARTGPGARLCTWIILRGYYVVISPVIYSHFFFTIVSSRNLMWHFKRSPTVHHHMFYWTAALCGYQILTVVSSCHLVSLSANSVNAFWLWS